MLLMTSEIVPTVSAMPTLPNCRNATSAVPTVMMIAPR